MILCVTHSKDYYTIDKVMQHFSCAGVKALRFNTDLIYSEIQLSQTVDASGWNMQLTTPDFSINTRDIEGVWFRKIWSPSVLLEIDDEFRPAVSSEINSTLYSFFMALEERVPCVNRLSVERSIASDKFLQLRVAVRADLAIPPTLVSANAADVMSFYEEHDQNIITKLQHALSFGMGKPEKFMPTTLITPDNIKGMVETLGVCPMIFQANITKAYELRIAYVNGKCFVGKIDTTAQEAAKTDWRNTTPETDCWQASFLPDTIQKKIDAMMQELGLLFGAIDMIVTPDNDYIFLEVNPSGEWGMLERDLDLPISKEISDTLIKHLNHDA